VVDGDTLVVLLEGRKTTVRYGRTLAFIFTVPEDATVIPMRRPIQA
jgi:hypothetical protein